jgi:hypothetical protein
MEFCCSRVNADHWPTEGLSESGIELCLYSFVMFQVERGTHYARLAVVETGAGGRITPEMHYIAMAKINGEIKRIRPVQKIHLSFTDRLLQYISSKEFSPDLIASVFEMIRLST